MKRYSPFATPNAIIQVLLERSFVMPEVPRYFPSEDHLSDILVGGGVGHSARVPHSVKVQGQSWASRLHGSVGLFSGWWYLLSASASRSLLGLSLHF